MISSEKIRLSAVVTTKNEEKKLAMCLGSLFFADEIVLVDSGSTDRTLEIAESFGCRVFVEPWRGGGPQKQSAIEKCSHDWVLILDADEVFLPEGVGVVRKIVESAGPSAAGYTLLRRSYIGDRWVRHSDWWPDRTLRLFDRRKGRMEGINHSRVVVDGKAEDLEAVIDHFSFDDYTHMLSKANRFSSWTSDELFKKGRRAGPFAAVSHSAWMFFKIYILKKGFLDGFDGLVVTVYSAICSFFKYAKLHEMSRNKR